MNPSLFLHLLFLSATLLHSPLLASSAKSCHLDDEYGLLNFQAGITRDPSGMLSSWKRGTYCCTWAGVTCSNTTHRVTQLSLSGSPGKKNAFLSGLISSSFPTLEFLTTLSLQNLGDLSGPIPDSIGKLVHLKEVYIENSKLSGPIPKDIGNLIRLEQLLLTGNRLQGSIPGSISKLTNLTVLLLGDNLLSGPIPLGIKNLKKLAVLNLENNQISGTIPNFFHTLTKIESISLSHNKLSGSLPPYLPKDIFGFRASHNGLTGQIPSTWRDLQTLQVIELSGNRLSGRVPATLGNFPRLSIFNVSYNNLEDPFPKLYNESISTVDLSYNNFHLGAIPEWITSAFSLNRVGLAKCGIKSSLEDWKPVNLNSVFLYYVDISENEIFGSPSILFNASEFLQEFRASGNKLRFNMGRIKIPKLMRVMDVSRNLAYGYVPKAAARIGSFNVSYNHLCGQIPATKFPASAFVGNDCLCGSPLPPCKA